MKRHLVVAVLGLPLTIVVTAEHRSRLKQVWADKKSRNNALDAWMKRTKAGYKIEVVERPGGSVGFVGTPSRANR